MPARPAIVPFITSVSRGPGGAAALSCARAWVLHRNVGMAVGFKLQVSLTAISFDSGGIITHTHAHTYTCTCTTPTTHTHTSHTRHNAHIASCARACSLWRAVGRGLCTAAPAVHATCSSSALSAVPFCLLMRILGLGRDAAVCMRALSSDFS